MKVSLNWAQELAKVDLLNGEAVEALVRKIGAQLGEIEEVVDLSQPYQHIVIAKVVSCEKHPNADKLHVCKVDDGGITKDVPRDEHGCVQVVCGAPNVREGLTVAWLPPGATVPSTYDKERFVLEARELRGVVSNGMLASAAELALGDDHSGLLEISDDIKPGTLFADAFKLNDTIIDIENKMFTHRPDCFGQLGVTRELAGIQGEQFTSPDWYLKPVELPASNSALKYEVENQIPELCPRYMLVGIDNVKVGPSPAWLQTYLSRVGIRPINNIVDMTNYLMVLTGQPLHAFDYDKVTHDGTAKIVIRKPKPGEKLPLLDGKTIEPRKDAILICDQEKPIALGGVMGGNNSEIDASTTRILIECANFDMYNIRRTAMEHGIFTDSVTRFNKGQSPWQCPAILHKAVALVQELSNDAQMAGAVIDTHHGLQHNPQVSITPVFINERLGSSLDAAHIAKLLTNVEFTVTQKDASLEITAPFWRTDIAIPEDIVEEVGRLYGYDRLPLTLPVRNLTPVVKNADLELKKQLRGMLAGAGANEALTYSFVHSNLLEKVGQNQTQAFQLSNALSPELQYYRLSVTPSLLDKVHSNIKAGFDNFAMFEFGKSHNKQTDKTDEGLPKEASVLALVLAANDKATKAQYYGAPFYQAKQYLQYLLQSYGVADYVTLEPLEGADLYQNQWVIQMAAPFAPARSAVLRDKDGLIWGVVGEYKGSVRKTLKLPDFCAGFEIDHILFQLGQSEPYQPLSRFPKVQKDISFKVPQTVSYRALYDVVQLALLEAGTDHGYITDVEPLDIYESDDKADTKHIALRITLTHFERTMTTEEATTLLDIVAARAHHELKAERL